MTFFSAGIVSFFSIAKAGTARPSETKAAKAIANFFMEFLLVVRPTTDDLWAEVRRWRHV
jgi:hypothetical protein